ncbi:UvrB/UvrC protein [Gemmatirosa kalamazoonensis]|uniref:UvrB/UvrC protein n=1 Tax=Gemmatirosa kalamazoonensis TaxID=861299 RepID=W0RLV2_9BACT|nr:UvrB/UvrC protein [Gemmatirosa kalamazoonensis]
MFTPIFDEIHVAGLRALVRAGAEDRPGVYRMIGADGDVIYVGKSKRVRSRLLSYFRGSYPADKGARIVREAWTIEWEYVPSEFGALLHELRLIKKLRPRFNVMLKRDAEHWVFIRLTRGAAPKLQVVRDGGRDEPGMWYGPYQGFDRVTEAVRELSDVLGLRDCANDVKMRFADQQELFPDALAQIAPRTPRCIRHEIRKCLGPCVAACSHDEYDERVALARAFLDGVDDAPIVTLRSRMEECAEALDFERAALLRDKVRRLEGLRDQFERMRYATETLSFLYTVPGHGGEDRTYLIRRGRVRGEMAAPRRPRDRELARERVAAVFDAPEPRGAAVSPHEVDELLLLSSWFRRFPDELARTATPESWLAGGPAEAIEAA